MKKDQVPQDDEKLLDGKTRDVQYAVDQNGKYTTVLSLGWEPKNIVMKQVWNEINSHVEDARKEVIAGKKSPLFYFMQKNMMDVKLLSEYSGISRWKVRRHLKPRHFNNAKISVLDKYAKTFNLSSTDDLFRVDK